MIICLLLTQSQILCLYSIDRRKAVCGLQRVTVQHDSNRVNFSLTWQISLKISLIRQYIKLIWWYKDIMSGYSIKRIVRANVIKYHIPTPSMAWQWVIFLCNKSLTFFNKLNVHDCVIYALNRLKIIIHTCKKGFRNKCFQIKGFFDKIIWLICIRNNVNSKKWKECNVSTCFNIHMRITCM